MIQIDGLALKQLERALQEGRMPYLSKLLKRRHFTKESFYSGVPSTTPAVQAEIFYGLKTVVPAFEFLHREHGRIYRMYESESADEIERKMVESGAESLLQGGHVYSNIYRGGAQESHYCSGDLALDRITKRINPLKRIILSLLYFPSVIRGISLGVLELAVASYDVFLGVISNERFLNELKFLPARLGICIGAREAIRFRVLLDIERGVRLIHANFLGYDEQAHRRGPDSAFAHWSLKGIDSAIRDIHYASDRSEFRDYELLVYSDHGQESATPYPKIHGRTVESAIAEVFSRGATAEQAISMPPAPARRKSMREHRRQLFHQMPGHKGFGTVEECREKIIVTAMGPIGHIYVPIVLHNDDRDAYAKALVAEAKVPLVLLGTRGGDQIKAFNARGEWRLPDDGVEVIGQDHPFFDDVVADLVRLCQHVDAGDFIISGWNPYADPVTFPPENGAHGGPGSQETHGFVLIPDRIFRWHRVHQVSAVNWMRGTDLRDLALHFLKRNGQREERTPEFVERDATLPLRIMTYNIHRCTGLDGRVRPERIARVINYFDPDVVAVQEVDVHRLRSGGCDQAQTIADHLRMGHAFYAVFDEATEKYGIALFSRFPFKVVKTALLAPSHSRKQEARGAMWVTLDLGEQRKPVHVVNTHFGLRRDARRLQAEVLMGPGWLGDISEDEPLVVCGDFNSTPRSAVWKLLRSRLRDVQLEMPGHRPKATFPTLKRLLRIDHLFVSRHFRVKGIEIPTTATVLVASDHFPICVELLLHGENEKG